MTEVLQVAFLVRLTFSVILLAVKGENILETCVFFGPTQTRKHFQDVPSWYLILLLHPTDLHENITLQLCSFSHEDDITKLSHYEP